MRRGAREGAYLLRVVESFMNRVNMLLPVPASAAASRALRLGPLAAVSILLALTVMPSASIQSGSLRYKLFSEADHLCYTQVSTCCARTRTPTPTPTPTRRLALTLTLTSP